MRDSVNQPGNAMAKAKSTQLQPDPPSWMVCAGCSCLCDDILKPSCSHLSASDELLRESNLCFLGIDWLKGLNSSSKNCVLGKETSFEIALSEAKRLLAKSKSPLISGLDGLCTASQSAAWRLADRTRATIDISLSNAGRGGMNALQRVGRVTATMGEVAQRSDFVLLWFVDPQQTHPRLWERVVRPKHDLQRFVVVVDETETFSAKQANLFIRLDRENGSLALSVLRALLTGARLNQQAVAEQTGCEISRWQSLLDRIVSSSYGALFSNAASDSEFDSESELLAKLIRVLNDSTRFVNLSLRNDYNAQSAENVLAWSSGFATGVNLNRGFPRSCFDEHSAHSILNEGACDLILLASTLGLQVAWKKLGAAAQLNLKRTPTIVLNELGDNWCKELFQPHVEIAVSRPGFSSVGDFCRLDEVLIPLSKIDSANPLVSAGEVFNRLAAD